jgi:hypothetical protein
LGAFERLNLAFFVHTQDQGVVRGIEVKAHDVAHLFHEERVGGEFEALGAMRLESEELEVAADRALGNPGFFGDQTHTPVGSALGFGVQDAIDQGRHLLVIMGAGATGPQLVMQTCHSLRAIALAPQADGGRADRAALGNHIIRQSGSRQQDDPCPPHQRMGHTARTRQGLQLLPLLLGQHHRHIGSTHRASSISKPKFLALRG